MRRPDVNLPSLCDLRPLDEETETRGDRGLTRRREVGGWVWPGAGPPRGPRPQPPGPRLPHDRLPHVKRTCHVTWLAALARGSVCTGTCPLPRRLCPQRLCPSAPATSAPGTVPDTTAAQGALPGEPCSNERAAGEPPQEGGARPGAPRGPGRSRGRGVNSGLVTHPLPRGPWGALTPLLSWQEVPLPPRPSPPASVTPLGSGLQGAPRLL